MPKHGPGFEPVFHRASRVLPCGIISRAQENRTGSSSEDNEISIAQTNFNTTESNIQEIPSGTGIPDATSVTNSVAATSGIVRGNGNGNAGLGDDNNSTAITSASVSAMAFFVSFGISTLAAII